MDPKNDNKKDDFFQERGVPELKKAKRPRSGPVPKPVIDREKKD